VDIFSAFLFIFWLTSDYVTNNALYVCLKETILDINCYRIKTNGISNKQQKEGKLTGLIIFCFLKRVIEGKIEGQVEVTGGRGRRLKQLMYDFKETKGYWKMREDALDRTIWRTRFGPVVRQTAE
jgi:hypothetical protein